MSVTDWRADLPPLLAPIATEAVTGKIVAYRAGTMRLDQLCAYFAARRFVDPERLVHKRPGETVVQMERRVEAATYSTPGSWDEVDRARSVGMLDANEYLAVTRAVHAARSAG